VRPQELQPVSGASNGQSRLALFPETDKRRIPPQSQGGQSTRHTKMAAGIGEKLRLERETRGIALRDISENTRISMRYLEAIESDDYRRLPGGIFNRSFIRAYAKFVGYDEHEAIEEYSRMMREHGESPDDAAKSHRSLVYTDESGTHHRSPLWGLLWAMLILALLSVGVWALLHFYFQTAHQRNPVPQPGPVFARMIGKGETHEAAV
jgi:transcriptional regulator with XRE-family HTH domain